MTPREIQTSILAFIKVHPNQTHADVAAELQSLADPHRIAMNMDRLAKDGRLVIDPLGARKSDTKRYSFPPIA
jgi:hypothetical protein